MNAKIETSVIQARATCNVCTFDRGGREAPAQAIDHVEETGHAVTVNSTSFTIIKPGERLPFYEDCAERGGVCDCAGRPCAIGEGSR